MIRRAGKKDARAAALLLYDCLGPIAEKMTHSRDPKDVLKTLEEYIKEDENRLSYRNALVKVANDEIAGIAILYHGKDADKLDRPIIKRIGYKLDQEADADEFYLDTLSVSAEFQNQGFGTELIEAMEAIAIEKDYSKLALNVEYENKGAKRLYERMGFKTEKTTFIIEKPFHHMVKTINR
ncbi:GNAT family N-acetyltransferase [Heyndrickxia acidicola]|uniref:GNAT family N-acetyltransferase n=1 Tax=Heyndrickxia acidicola TaxID=209389 RepID=A0ABU6MDI7_9BACI|nr:GNAT family N-acetyltransferase [Heyndrickxia acidicola]MED1201733.1 GNAT family N-acetyltransferase [Heyndrickxia acidicola]